MFIKIVIFGLIVFTLTGCYNTRYAPIDESITKPVLVEKPFFIYPQSARENRISGKVHLIMSLNTYGNVDSVVIDKSSGYKSLDKSAAEFVKNFKFNPALKNGTPINFYVSYTIDYTLAEKNKTAIEYIKNITELQKRIKNAPPAEQVELQKEMLALHNNFIMTNTDYPSYNQYIREFINKDQYKKWRKQGESWPLHFLVFH
ncbi:MAG: energy transducer TonB, partial [Calditrichaceae bacterium]